MLKRYRLPDGTVLIKVKPSEVNAKPENYDTLMLSTLTRSKPKMPTKGILGMYKRLMNEATKRYSASKPLEIIPILITNWSKHNDEAKNDIIRFGIHDTVNDYFLTNVRSILNSKYEYEVNYDEEHEQFLELYYSETQKGTYNQLRTASIPFGWTSSTARAHTDEKRLIHPPVDWDKVEVPFEGFYLGGRYLTKTMLQRVWRYECDQLYRMVRETRTVDYQRLLAILYPGRSSEIYDRTMEWFTRVRFIVAGIKQDDKSLQHLIELRTAPDTQLEARVWANLLKEVRSEEGNEVTADELIKLAESDFMGEDYNPEPAIIVRELPYTKELWKLFDIITDRRYSFNITTSLKIEEIVSNVTVLIDTIVVPTEMKRSVKGKIDSKNRKLFLDAVTNVIMSLNDLYVTMSTVPTVNLHTLTLHLGKHAYKIIDELEKSLVEKDHDLFELLNYFSKNFAKGVTVENITHSVIYEVYNIYLLLETLLNTYYNTSTEELLYKYIRGPMSKELKLVTEPAQYLDEADVLRLKTAFEGVQQQTKQA